MLNFYTIEWVLISLSLILAYLFTETIVGYFQSWVALKMGDDTAKQAGFLTFNPMVHIDPIGIVCLVLLRVGWGKHIPINHYNIRGKIRLALVYFADAFAHLVVAVIALASIIKLFGLNVIGVVRYMVVNGYVLPKLAAVYPDSNSLAVVGGLILLAMIYLSLLLATINVIIQGFRFAMMVFYPDFMQSRHASFIVIFIPVLLIVFLIEPLHRLLGYGVLYVGAFLGYLLGAS